MPRNNDDSTTKPLLLIKASAGSGKTFMLVRQFLRLCFEKAENPMYFSTILAITFTNKATQEMRNRILEELEYMAEGSEKSDHAEYLIKNLDLSVPEVQEIADRIRTSILLNYEKFAVRTIDSFSMRIFRNFAREMQDELGINPAVDVQMELEILNEKAIESLIAEMDIDDEKWRWFRRIMEEKYMDGTRFKMKSILKSYISEFYSEEVYAEEMRALGPEEAIEILNNVNDEIEQKERKIENLKEQFLKIFSELNYDYRIEPKSIIAKLINADTRERYAQLYGQTTLRKIVETGEGLKNTTGFGKVLYNLALDAEIDLNVFLKILSSFQKCIAELIPLDGKLNIINEAINAVGALTMLTPYIKGVSSRERWITLSEVNKSLSKTLENLYVPFLYEKIAARYNHLFVDEFQDTSNLQWRNIKPLIDHNISEGNMNLIVGDVKQAIYRWRGGDWEILNTQLEREYREDQVEKIVLDKNYRSLKNIISFNNLVFQSDALPASVDACLFAYLQDKSKTGELDPTKYPSPREMYENSRQGYPHEESPDGNGYVKGIVYKKEKTEGYSAIDSQMKEYLAGVLEDLHERGYESGQVAILCRDGTALSKITDILDALQSESRVEGFPEFLGYINEATLKLISNKIVKYILSNLKLIQYPENEAYLMELYVLLGNNPAIPGSAADLRDELPEYLNLHKEIRQSSILEIVKILLNKWPEDIKSSDSVYVNSLLQTVLKYQANFTSSIPDFLEWWEMEEPSIKEADGADRIRLLTIHKAKGLEFDVVLIPYLKWNYVKSLGQTKNYVYADIEELGSDSQFPIQTKGWNINSEYAETVAVEYFLSATEILNLFYVACTRAKRELYFISELYKKKFNKIVENKKLDPEAASLLDPLLKLIFEKTELWEEDGRYQVTRDKINETCLLEYGEKTKPARDVESETDGVLLSPTIPKYSLDLPALRMIPLAERTLGASEERRESITAGNLLHQIMERVSDRNSVDKALRIAVLKGEIEEEERQAWEELILKIITSEDIAPFYRSSLRVFNERAVIAKDGKKYIPDRVVLDEHTVHIIDYKTGDELPKHDLQVGRYMDLFMGMGHENVSGYVLYTDSIKLKKVN